MGSVNLVDCEVGWVNPAKIVINLLYLAAFACIYCIVLSLCICCVYLIYKCLKSIFLTNVATNRDKIERVFGGFCFKKRKNL